TAIHVAAGNGFIDIVKLLVEAGCRIDQLDNSNRTPFFKAALSGHKSVAQYLIEKGANVNRQDKLLDTPLYSFIQQKIETVELILKNGGSFGTTNNSGKTPLMMAAKSQIPQLVQLLIDYNADPHKKDN
ncbi:hypothetical protein DICPUDRAFT_12612, partial [Dictyostelium purpureum]